MPSPQDEKRCKADSAPLPAESLRRRLLEDLDRRGREGLERTLASGDDGPETVCLADNDYLNLSRDPEVIAAAREALERRGASSRASPLIAGYGAEHRDLEKELTDWCGFPHALVWNTGFAANSGVLGSLPKPGDLVLADRLIHASMISGILASGARLRRYPHLDLDSLEKLLEESRNHDGEVWVVTESVFSMDGDHPDLGRLAGMKRRHRFILVLDEAHATGWHGATGAGLAEREGVTGQVDILVGTCGKALGGFGAYTLFHDETIRRHLLNFAGEFVYSTYLPPACAAAARAAIRRIRESRATGESTEELSRRWRQAVRTVVQETPDGDSPVVPIPMGDSSRAVSVAGRLSNLGWRVGAVRPPTVPEGGARLRLSLKTGLPEDAPWRFAAALRRALGETQ